MSKYLVTYDEWTEVSEQTGTIQNIDDGCPIEVSTTQVKGSGVILYPWEMKPFSNVQLYVRGYNKNPLPTEVRVVPFEIGQGGGGGGSYVLPTATATRLGGVKIGQGITVAEDGTISGIDTWAADTPYPDGIYVTYNDDLYLCTTAHTSGSTFDNSKWKKIGGIDAWKTNTDYVSGDYVTYKNKLYLCITAHTSSTKFAPTKWQEIGELPIATATTLGGVKIGQGINVAADGTISGGTAEWKTATEYDVGNYVTFYNYGRQEWQDDTAYSAWDFVTNDGNLYKCIVSHTAGSIFADDLAANKWVLVPREGGLYICVKAHTSDDFHDDFIVDGKWNAIRNGIDFWSTTKHYDVGQYVTVPDNYKYNEWQANTSYAIGDVVTVYNRGKSEWATGTSYAIGDYATMGKALYRCGTAHTSTTFADDVAGGDWTLVDTIVEQFSALENHTSGSSFPTDFGDGKWKSKASQMETCICLLEHISDDFAANFAAGKWQAAGGSAAKNPPNLSVSQDNVILYYEESGTKTVTVNNDGNGAVDAISYEPDIAAVSASGNSITVEGKKRGTANIMVYSTETDAYSPGIARFSVNCKEREIGICLVQSGGGAGTWARVDEFGNPLSRDFDASYPWSDIETVTVDSQVMVKVPKYYVKYGTIQSGTYAGKKARWVSRTKQDGYHIYPAFAKNGYVMDCFYIGAYEAYNAGNDTAGSAAGKTPWVSLGGFENAKTYCANRGAEWHLQTIYERHAISLLFLLEYGHPNAQAAIGAGNSNSSAKVSTGSTNAVYRGMHELWGNVMEHCDGLKGDGSGNILIWDNKGNHTYKTTGKKPGGTKGQFILDTLSDKGTDFDFGDVFIPGSTAAEKSATYPDAYFGLANDFAPRVSGDWSDGTNCGLFFFHVNGSLPSSGSAVGFRVAKDGTVTEEVA